jgi:glycosyltransferase involved in cell wall biosynthesis
MAVRPLKILFVNPGLAMGGAEHSLLLLLQELKQRGVRPVMALFGVGPFAKRLSELELVTHFLDLPEDVRASGRYAMGIGAWDAVRLTRRTLPAAVQLADIARKEQVDLIHTNGMKAHLLGGVAGRLTRRPVVWHVRDFPPEANAGRVFRAAMRTLPRAVITNSRALAEALRRDWRTARRPRIAAIYNPVDLKRFDWTVSGEGIRRELGLRSDSELVGMVAHLTPWKGHPIFLRAARMVFEERPTARFLIAGGPIYETEGHEGYDHVLRRMAYDLGLAGKVHFLGVRDDIPEILRSLAVLVHPPIAPEPFGRAIAEAQACGVPIVASDAGSARELLVHMTSGLLVEPNNPTALAEAILFMLKESQLAHVCRGYGHQQARAWYSMKEHADRVQRVYDAVLA